MSRPSTVGTPSEPSHDLFMRIRLALIGIAIAALGVGLALAMDGRIVPGVRVGGYDVGGRSTADARAMLEQITRDARVVLVLGDSSVRIDRSSGIGIDLESSLDAALAVGRSGSPLDRAGAIVNAVVSGNDVGLRRAVVESRKFDSTLDLLVASVTRAPVDGDVRVTPAGVAVTEPVAGIQLDHEAAAAAILGARDVATAIDLPLRYVQPELDAEAIAAAADAARNASLPLVVTAGTERTVVEPERQLALLSVARESAADGTLLVVTISMDGLASLVGDVAAALDGPVREAVLVPGAERLAVLPGRDGVIVDRASAETALRAAIIGAERSIELPAAVTRPALTTFAAEQISEALVLAGGYTTYFPVNVARATNIGAAARTFDGMIVEPGEAFSFWRRIGEVSPRTGYVLAGTIIGGVSSEAIGGGLCQVSTTFFNAVASAGYEIDERHPHSYYIERYPLGLDAAVFAPSTDMRWTNDTTSQALIRAEATATSVSFWIYSAPLGRTVTFSTPSQWNVRWPSADQPADPGHVPGYVVPGRDTSVTRTVVAGGSVVHHDIWYSHYDPVWGGPAQ